MKKLLILLLIVMTTSCGRKTPQEGFHDCEIHMKDSTVLVGWNVRCWINTTSFEDTLGIQKQLRNRDIAYIIQFINPRKNQNHEK